MGRAHPPVLPSPDPRFALQTLVAALVAACASMASAQAPGAGDVPSAPTPPSAVQPSRDLAAPPRGEAAQKLPIVLRALSVKGQPDLEAVAEGDVEFRRGALVIRADKLTYDAPDDLARALGHVRVRREGAIYSGPELQLRVQRFEGFFIQPEYEFLRLQSGGRAERVDFIDSARSVATNAIYTSCPRDGSGDPAWVLQTDRVRMDFDANEGIAEGAVLRFLGVPILAAPRLSFPLTDDRKSGWLPPSFNLDSRSGLEVSAPYYWNIAPNRDATITPRVITRRGLGVDGEFRYLEPAFNGVLNLDLLPSDRVFGRERHALGWKHDGTLAGSVRYQADVQRVSDDAWWRDFPSANRNFTPRLLPTRLGAEYDLNVPGGEGLVYARAQHWQVLQGSSDLVVGPYQRSPQIGVRANGALAAGLQWGAETELNRFTLPTRANLADTRSEGSRWHALLNLSRPWREPGWWVVPRLVLNLASYRTDDAMSDGRRSASRVIPSFSIDSGLELERDTSFFGRNLRQTLEPRLHYVNTPFRAQSALPNFDSAERDFNATSIFADSAFTGIDRVSDAHQVTAGVTSRLLDNASGVEALRLGVVQRYLLRTQRITTDGVPVTQRLSDLLLVGGTSVIPNWAFDTALQYGADVSRVKRAVVTARYAPGEFRTVSATYRQTRGFSEQLEVGWQWPLSLSAPGPAAAATGSALRSAPSANACGGAWYTVGRVNFSVQERRITDSVIGFEYDAGCWIGRVVAERLSTGRSEATTRLLLQLELIGLSRIGANPLKVLKDNIPGYRLLREEGRQTPDVPTYD
jgi:LPS-assembly protein